MMDDNDPRHIVTLVADGTPAERAWNRPQNRDRCEPAPEFDGEIVDIPSRETTPAVSRQDEPPASRICLTFAKKPKSLEKGFVFGSGPKTCDVLLGAWTAGFTREHFRITFNARGEVIGSFPRDLIDAVTLDGSRLDRMSVNGRPCPVR